LDVCEETRKSRVVSFQFFFQGLSYPPMTGSFSLLGGCKAMAEEADSNLLDIRWKTGSEQRGYDFGVMTDPIEEGGNVGVPS
tara:strand:- start:298 stop:543 length:246 start_codon:yes stop_codon:yes gene_type:complete